MGVYNDDNKIVISVTKNFLFHLDLLKIVRINLKHEIGFMIKLNESLFEHKIKNEIDQLLSKYKHGDDIHKHRKQ